ncbi:MAG: UDP-3-O-(3-hydroxymyristoyl)glucosamine N-acyltransferase [Terracidiphilus sp.]
MKLGELIEKLGGKLMQGNAEFVVNGVNSTELAGPTDLVFAEDAASVVEALASDAGVVVLKSGMGALSDPIHGSDEAAAMSGAQLDSLRAKCVVEAEQPRLWFARAAKLLKPAARRYGFRDPLFEGLHVKRGEGVAVAPGAVIGANAVLGRNVNIGPGAAIGEHVSIGEGTCVDAGAVIGEGVVIGEECRIYPRVVIYPGTTLGNRVVVHAGAVLGADGFGYVRDAKTGAYTQFPQQGTLLIEDDVEIGANSTIDRGALKRTRIGRGTKIDNLVHVGHNCNIGEDVILVMGTGISGSCTVGNGAVIAGQVGIGDHATIGPGVILGGQAGVLSGKTVTNDGLKPGTVLWGTPARPLKQVLRELAVVARLAKGKKPGLKD